MKRNAILLALACLALASCGGEPAKSSSPVASSSDSSSSSSKAEESSSKAESSSVPTSESTSSEETSSSEPTPVSSSSEQSSSSGEVPSSSEQTSSDSSASTSSNWTLTRADIPETQQSQYNRNFDFEVQSESGPVVLHGDYIQQGTGSNADFIQMRKTTKDYETDRIYFYVAEGSYTSVEFEFQHKIVAYSQQDVSGVPAIYSAEEIDESNGEEVEIEMKLSQDGTMYHCTAELSHGQFRFENVSPDYALYMTYFKAIA